MPVTRGLGTLRFVLPICMSAMAAGASADTYPTNLVGQPSEVIYAFSFSTIVARKLADGCATVRYNQAAHENTKRAIAASSKASGSDRDLVERKAKELMETNASTDLADYSAAMGVRWRDPGSVCSVARSEMSRRSLIGSFLY